MWEVLEDNGFDGIYGINRYPTGGDHPQYWPRALQKIPKGRPYNRLRWDEKVSIACSALADPYLDDDEEIELSDNEIQVLSGMRWWWLTEWRDGREPADESAAEQDSE